MVQASNQDLNIQANVRLIGYGANDYKYSSTNFDRTIKISRVNIREKVKLQDIFIYLLQNFIRQYTT